MYASYLSNFDGRSVCANGSGDIFCVGLPNRYVAIGEEKTSGTLAFQFQGPDKAWEGKSEGVLPNHGQLLGGAVALDINANYCVAGAPGETINDNKQCGAFYIAKNLRDLEGGAVPLDAERWELPAPEADDVFGSAVSISADGGVIAAAAPGRNGHAGMVVTYRRVDDAWVTESPLVPDETDGKGKFGTSVSLNMTGHRLAIGCPEAENKRGAVYLYRRNDHSEWVLMEKLTGDALDGEQFGFRVSLSGDGHKLAVSSPEGKNEDIKTGAAWWFDDGLQSCQRLSLPSECAGQAYKFGHAIALTLEGTRLAVGASLVPGTNVEGSATTGRVYFYE